MRERQEEPLERRHEEVRRARCVMYRQTVDGTRCVLMPPEEWRLVRQRYERHCHSGGAECPVYVQYLRIRGDARQHSASGPARPGPAA